MKHALNFRRGVLVSATACALFALAPIGALTQDPAKQETHGIVVANMDRSVRPGDDFYRYANGAWIERTELPPDRNYIDPYGSDFDDLTRKRMADLIVRVVEEAAKANAPAGSNTRKRVDLNHRSPQSLTVDRYHPKKTMAA